jgi:hypothetical protein
MVRMGLLITSPPRPDRNVITVDDGGCSESLMSHSDISDDDANEGGESLVPVWQDDDDDDDDDEDEEVGGGDGTMTPLDAKDDTSRCQYPLSIALDLPALEITISLSYEDEQPSPSSVSCQNTAVLPEALIPALPLTPQDPRQSAIRVPSYQLACQRRVEELTRHASYDFAMDRDFLLHQSHGQLEIQQVHRTLSSSLSLQGTRSSSLTLPHHQHEPPPPQRSSRSNSSTSFQGRVRPRSCTATPRFLLMFCAFVLVILSVRDRVESSERFIMEARIVEEVAFPLHPQHMTKQQKAELPKYYLPSSTALTSAAGISSTDKAASTASKGMLRERKKQSRLPNLAMARTTPQARPVFVPNEDHSTKRERFVFDPQQQESQSHSRSSSSATSHRHGTGLSWTTCFASVILVGMLVDTGWKEYQKGRVRDEQRTL